MAEKKEAPQFSADRVCIMRAFQPGDVVMIETDRPYSVEQAARMRDMLSGHGIKFVLLDPGMRVVAREEKPE